MQIAMATERWMTATYWLLRVITIVRSMGLISLIHFKPAHPVSEVTPGELAVIPFNLATQETQDIELGYMGFQLNYGLSLVAETPAGDPAIELNFDVDGNEWLMEAEQGVEVFVYHHENLGYSDIALYMGSPGDYVVGTGAIAEFSIVVEEVIFGLQSVNIDIPVILNGGFKRSGFVSSQGITLNLVGKPVSTDEQMLPLDAVMVFPNPVNTGVLHAQLRSDQPGMIKSMQAHFLQDFTC